MSQREVNNSGFGGYSLSAARPPLLRLFLTAVAAALLICVTLAAAVAAATYSGRLDRSFARVPHDWSPEGGGEPAFRYFIDITGATTTDHLPIAFVYLDPVNPLSAPPPGLVSWPEPGEAIVSPAVGHHLDEIIGPTYRVSPTTRIGAAGLASLREPVVYLRPPDGLPDGATWGIADGFGVPARTAVPWGEAINGSPLSYLIFVLLVFGGIPAGTLLVVSFNSTLEPRALKNAQLEILGARPSVLWWWNLRLVCPPLAVGAGLSLAVAGISAVFPVSLPVVDFAVSPVDVRGHWSYMLLGFGAGLALVSGITAACCVLKHDKKRLLRARRQRQLPGWLVFIVTTGYLWLAGSVITEARAGGATVPMMLAATVVATVAAFLVCPWMVSQIAAGLVSFGVRRGGPAAIVLGRQV